MRQAGYLQGGMRERLRSKDGAIVQIALAVGELHLMHASHDVRLENDPCAVESHDSCANDPSGAQVRV
jgi:hypothetical protein